jgi:hypothetical protein
MDRLSRVVFVLCSALFDNSRNAALPGGIAKAELPKRLQGLCVAGLLFAAVKAPLSHVYGVQDARCSQTECHGVSAAVRGGSTHGLVYLRRDMGAQGWGLLVVAVIENLAHGGSEKNLAIVG